ncbi:midnolin-like isoform X1 [Brienomyrus brachyistius]|uniref:midnolin-like isoform X1 n=1 Tax=Brienomyrus brachyistius TaxID=42636 RepID=UPI0020B4095A|nr:midnolin-like isoform X1 [Brienomyrus brachyistius]XP_048832383.1 midnolin-like isoform X1 [Brienomyrus brachyistius]
MDQHPTARSCTSRGAPSCEAVSSEPSMNLYIHSTTGTRFELSLPLEETVEGLKRRLSQRLKVPKERLTLLHKETRLSTGKLQDLGVSDGSRLTLVPTVEAGLMSQVSRPEQSVMQALESLTETQVSDFLSGRSPLTLALRVGDHMMFVQLQLAAQQSGGQQLQHRHVIARGGPETAGASAAVPGNSGAHVRLPHHPYPHPHAHPPTLPHTPTLPHVPHLHPTPVSSVSPSAFPASSPVQAMPPAYPSSSAGQCSPPPRLSPLPNGLLRSHLPPAVSSSPATPCPEQTNCSAKAPSNSSPPSARSRKPGAIIESFVNHAPGVFSGTFSGTLHPNCQDSSGRPRRDIGTILQILNDLLSATRHYQGVPASLTQLRCQTQCGPPSPPPSPPTPGLAGLSARATSVPAPSPAVLHPLVQCQSQIHMCKPSGDRLRQTENRATRCKVEQLQLLMQQKRLRRKARRDSRAPYPWLSNRKSGRSNSNSSVSSDGSLDLDFDDSVWKPDVKADMKSEFVVA